MKLHKNSKDWEHEIIIYTAFKSSVPTSQKTHYISITNTVQLMPFMEMVSVYSEDHKKHINTPYGKMQFFLI
jgi:hypothetical protein